LINTLYVGSKKESNNDPFGWIMVCTVFYITALYFLYIITFA
jgi:hypothetical protein